MQIHKVEQGTSEWLSLRAGIPTASSFGKIITPGGQASKQAEIYSNEKVAELVVGKPIEGWEGNKWTEAGKDLEAQAVDAYAFIKEVDLEVVGFVTEEVGPNKQWLIGCSPDRFVHGDGLLEMKVPKPSTHIEYLLSGKVPNKYIPQIQGQLYGTGRKWCDWMSYHPEMEPLIIRVMRDEQYITALSGGLNRFCATVDAKLAKLEKLGYYTPVIKEAA